MSPKPTRQAVRAAEVAVALLNDRSRETLLESELAIILHDPNAMRIALDAILDVASTIGMVDPKEDIEATSAPTTDKAERDGCFCRWTEREKAQAYTLLYEHRMTTAEAAKILGRSTKALSVQLHYWRRLQPKRFPARTWINKQDVA